MCGELCGAPQVVSFSMALAPDDIASFDEACRSYAFPLKYFDFNADQEVKADDVQELEVGIRAQLTASEPSTVKDGLSNVVYWGYGQIDYRANRVDRFRQQLNSEHIAAFQTLIRRGTPSLTSIKKVGMPEFSGVSFISKILAFLNPDEYCVLDWQITKLAGASKERALSGLEGISGTQIRVTARNEAIYDGWRRECKVLSETYYKNRYRAVDVERGFFALIQANRVKDAARIYSNM